jgi:hypothetical protein
MSATGKFQQPISGFSPLSFGGCVLWLDATVRTSFALSGSSNITAWYDESPISNHATSVVGGSPVLSNAAINGRPAVYFSNAPSIGGSVSLTNAAMTGFMVVRPLQDGTGRNDQRIFSAATSGTSDWNDNGRFLIGINGSTSIFRFNRGNTYIPQANMNASNTYVLSWAYNGASNFLYLNGADGDVAQGVALANTAFNVSQYRLGNQVTTTTETYNGLIGEVLIYNDILSDVQRRAIEGYLGWKWGIAPDTTFSPLTSLSNCAVWFDGADASTFTLSGSNITQWRDKAGSNVTTNIGTPVYVSNAINGMPGVDMNVGAGFYVTPMSNAANTNTISVYGVLTPSNTSQNNARIFTVGRISDGTTNNDFTSSHLWTLFRVQTPGLYMQHNNNSIYFNGGLPAGTPVLISLVFDGGTATLRTNGYSRGTLGTGNTLNFNRIGIFKNINPNAGSSYDSMAGQLGEFLIFYAAHNEVQRVQVESYLASKWGLGTRAPATFPLAHPYRTRMPFLRDFQPTDVPGCIVWLDAADSASIVLSGSNVTLWRDKSSTGNNFSTVTGSFPTYSNGIVTFSSGPVMRSAASISLTTSTTVYIASKLTSGGCMLLAFDNIQPAATTGDYSIRYFGDVLTPTNTGDFGSSYAINGISNVIYSASTYLARHLIIASSRTNGTTTVTLSSSLANRFYIGEIYEVLIYSGTQTTSDRYRLETYLATKWNFRGAMGGSPHPYRYGPWNGTPLTAASRTDCALWLDAADTSTLTFSGSNVTAWADKSGNGRNATAVGTVTTTTQNGRTVMDLSPGGLFAISNYPWNTYSTTFWVARDFSILAHGRGPNSTYSNYIHPFNWFLSYIRDSGGLLELRDSVNALGAYVAPSNAYYTFSWGYGGGTAASPYNVNGTARTTTVQSGTARGNSTITALLETIGGQLCELVMFNGVLSTAQVRQIEGYLAWKWGIQSNLPSPSHPYSLSPWPGTPLELSTCQLWIDAQDSNAFTVSGSNVTAVFDKSPNAWSLGSAANATRGSTLFNGTYPSFYSTGPGLGTASTSLTQPLTVYFVGQSLNTWGSAFLFDSVNTAAGRLVLYAGAVANAGADLSPTNNGDSLSPHVLSVVYNGASSSIILNSTTTSGNVGSSSVNTIIISKGDGYRGHICELIFFSGAHTTTQRQQMMGYLAWKWGLQTKLTGRIDNGPALMRSLTPEFDPRSVGACAAWFDAADSTTLQFSSGSNISRWLDKSGNGYHATALASNNTAAYTPNTLGSYPVVTFSRATSSIFICPYGPATSNQPQTIFLVTRPADVTNAPSLISVGLNAQTFLTVDIPTWNSNNWIMGGRWGGMDGTTTTLQASSSRTDIVVGTWRSGVSYMAVNGTEYAISTQTPTSITTKASGGRTVIGTFYNAGGYHSGTYSGYFAEILIYSKFLTNAERQRIEGYLAWKWGLLGQLPATHPYVGGRF